MVHSIGTNVLTVLLKVTKDSEYSEIMGKPPVRGCFLRMGVRRLKATQIPSVIL